MYVECFRLSDVQRKLSLQIFHAFCLFVIIIMLALGDVWLKPCFPSFIHIIALDFQFFITTSVSGGGGWGWGVLLSNNTFTTSYLVSGGIWTGYDCLSFIPLLPDGNQLIIHSCRFLDMEQTKFRSASRAVGRNVHCCILMRADDFTLFKIKDLFSIWKKPSNCGESNYLQFSAPSKKSDH